MPKKDIRLIAKNALVAIKKSNMAVEINSAGFRKPIGEQYPSCSLLEIVYEMGIPITFGSDAHRPNQVGLNTKEIEELVKKIGFSKCATFRNRDIKITNF